MTPTLPPPSPFRHHDPLHRNWAEYYQAVQGRPPRETLRLALDRFDQEPADQRRFAVDLGCGDGRDTVEMLRRGWRVLAIDKEADAIARLTQRPALDPTHLETQIQAFETLALPPAVDLINASFCLQFCPQDQFPEFWTTVVAALKSGGRFAGQLIGDRDSWAAYPNLSVHTRPQVEALFQNFSFDYFEEEEHPGKTALGEEKHWHLFQIVARKN
ncbi:MAG TPA: class I SAM-dependent methyltransferase [Leptolyngbyaceae cyanobacterium M65_K2018_010]|nr:class I SAM-dependent methyltransferase [Leptolyngbyaceae cyanobacterium M65_K2018_010]